MTFPQSEPDTMVLPEVQFATGAEGFPVARVGDTAFAMLPGRGDTHFLATAWRVHRPLDELGRNDFYGHGGELAGEEAFRAKVLEQAEHAREELALGRREVRCHGNTPWGPSQGATVFAEGLVCHSTAGHGGFHLSSERNAKVDRRLRRPGGWYEEDAEWAIVALAFPHLFTSFERRSAEQTMKDSIRHLIQQALVRLTSEGVLPEGLTPAIQVVEASGWKLCTQSSALAASDSSPTPLSKVPWLLPTPRKLKRRTEKPLFAKI
mgnify:CR=1 FL=1